MPLFLCRWPNGDCSVVWARDKQEAVFELDQVGNAEVCPITRLPFFQVHFVLTEQGKLALEGFGEGTEDELFSFAYPLLRKTLMDVYGDGEHDRYETLPPARRALVAKAIETERNRVEPDPGRIKPPQTELGREIKKHMDAPSALIDRIVSTVAAQKLQRFKRKGKPH